MSIHNKTIQTHGERWMRGGVELDWRAASKNGKEAIGLMKWESEIEKYEKKNVIRFMLFVLFNIISKKKRKDNGLPGSLMSKWCKRVNLFERFT